MATPSCIVVYKEKDTGIAKYFTGWKQVTVARALDAKSNKITVQLLNSWRRYSQGKFQFKEDDIVDIYLSDGTGIDLNTDTPFMTGLVTQYTQGIDGGKAPVSVICQDRTYSLLNFRWSKSYTSKTAPQIISSIIGTLNTQYTQNPGYVELGYSTYIDTTRPDASAFPSKDLSLLFKTAYEWLEELSQVDFLNSGAEANSPVVTMPYMFWIDKSNELHWTSRQDTASSATIYEGDQNIFNYNFTKSVYDVINLVFYNAGKDKRGNGIIWYYYNDTTTLKGLRTRYIAMTDIARDYINELIKTDNVSSNLNGAITAAVTTITVDSAASFPATGTIRIDDEFIEYTGKNATQFTGCKRGSFGSGAGSHADDGLVEDASTFGDLTNDTFRTTCKARAAQRAKSMTLKTSGLRWKGTIEMRGNATYQPGDKVTLIFPSYFINQDLRIIDIRDSFNKSGWFTTLELEEDIPEVATI